MKAMVLAAGLGERMRPLTLIRAKPVLPVLNRPLIHWTLERLRRAGVTDVAVNLHHLPRSVRSAVGDGHRFGLRVRYSFEREILGTGGGPRKLRRWLGDEPILLVNGDVLFDFDLRDLVRRHRKSGARATLALRPNPDPRRYAPVVTDFGGAIRSLRGLPRPARGTVSLFTGIHVLDPALLDRLQPGPSDSVRDLYAPLVAAGERLQGVRVRGAWYDLGDPSLYLASQIAMLRGLRALLHPQARVARGARVVRSILGEGAQVEAGARIERSLLWEDVKIGSGARVSGSVLASGVRIAAGERVENQVVTAKGRARL